MTLRRLEILQWSGLLAGAGMWAFAHVFGYGVTLAECNPGSQHWGINNDVWQIALLSTAAVLAMLAETAAVGVLLATREITYDRDDPPPSRIRTLAIAAAATNVIFFFLVVLDLFATVFSVVCRGA